MKPQRKMIPALAALIAIVGTSACDDEDPEGPSPTIAIAVAPTSLSVQQGQSQTATVTLTRGGDFDGAVSLSVEGAPTGVTATVTPTSLSGAPATATVNVTVAAAAAAGNSTLTVRAEGSGVTDATATLALTVTAAPAGSYTLAVTPTSATVAQGASTQTTVNLTRTNGFAGEVTLAATGLPAGVTATFDPAATTANTSTLTLSAAADAAVGASTVTITGTATGQENKTATFALTVEATATGGNVSWQFCPAFGVPVWVAYMDGDGDWVQAGEGDDENEFTMQFDEDRGAVAYATVEDEQSVVNVFYGLRTELELQGGNLCEGTGTTKTVNGSVAGLGATDQAYVTMGTATAVLLPGVGTDFTLEEVEDGPQDLIATRVELDVSGDEPALRIGELIIRRDLNPADDETLPVLDFDGDEPFEPIESTVTVANANGDQTFVVSGYFTENGAVSGFFTGLPGVGETLTYAGIPADQQEATDLHLLSVVALDDAEDPTSTRIAQQFFLEATDRTLTLGPVLDAVTVTSVAGAPYPRLQATYTPQDEYDDYFLVAFTQPDHSWLLAATREYIGTDDVELTIPDFTGTAGWDPDAWALEAGVQTDWFFSASGWSADGGIVMSPFVEGGEFLSALRFGSITP